MVRGNRASLIREASEQSGIPMIHCERALNAMVEAFRSFMKLPNGSKLELRGFGNFIVRVKEKKAARDIKKNKDVMIPRRKTLLWRPCAGIKLDVKKRYTLKTPTEAL